MLLVLHLVVLNCATNSCIKNEKTTSCLTSAQMPNHRVDVNFGVMAQDHASHHLPGVF